MKVSKKILIVEDNSVMFSVLKDMLEKEGHSILLSETGEGAIEIAKADNPDLVITDTLLPDIDGFEVCRRIKNFETESVPMVIITTADVDTVDAVRAHEAGANDYCAKTSDSSHLVTAVRGLV